MDTKPTRAGCKNGLMMLATVLFIIVSVTCSQAQNSNDAEWLIDVLNIEEGSVVADIGAGDGRFSMAMARQVGPSGKVFSTELGADSAAYLQKVVKEARVSNITVMEGHPSRTNLPKNCCDAIFLRRVYHHFQDPAAMNKSIWQSLKPGGRLAVIDFSPRSGESVNPQSRASGSGHGVTAQTVVSELKETGFNLVSSEQRSDRDVYVVMQKKEQ